MRARPACSECGYGVRSLTPVRQFLVFKEDGETYTEEFREYIDDALDLIGFANGKCFYVLGSPESRDGAFGAL